jgi:hypothetical protein
MKKEPNVGQVPTHYFTSPLYLISQPLVFKECITNNIKFKRISRYVLMWMLSNPKLPLPLLRSIATVSTDINKVGGFQGTKTNLVEKITMIQSFFD